MCIYIYNLHQGPEPQIEISPPFWAGDLPHGDYGHRLLVSHFGCVHPYVRCSSSEISG